MEIVIKNIIQSDLAINQEDGVKLFEAISQLSPDSLTISFNGITHISTAFLNEAIGVYAQKYGEKTWDLIFIYPDDKPIFETKVSDVIENALLGEEYDSWVTTA